MLAAWRRLPLLASLLVACSGSGDAGLPAESLVLITVDTLRADHVGAYSAGVGTPGMDRLAREGVTVVGACTPTPSTGPAHVSLFTGLHPWNHRVLNNAVPFDAAALPNLAATVRDAGFATAAFVSSYVLDRRWGFAEGFDHYHFRPTQRLNWKPKPLWSRAAATTDAALNWIEAQRGLRFFVWIHYFDPHDPYAPPKAFARPAEEPVDLAGKTLPPGVGSPEELADAIRRYRGEVTYTDSQIRRLLNGLGQLGMEERTAVILTSDHGEGLGDHGLLGHGSNLYDELVLVPLLVRAPGLVAGRRLEGDAQLEDLMPTSLALLGLPAPDAIDGHDLLPWLRGETASSPRPAVLGQRAPLPNLSRLFFERSGSRKWIGDGRAAGTRFRLDEDPAEADGTPSAETPQRLADAIPRVDDLGRPQLLDTEAREALEALGYLEPQ